MGDTNVSGDHVPRGKPLRVYHACKLFGKNVEYKDRFKWNFEPAIACAPHKYFQSVVTDYIRTVQGPRAGWKLPEMSLVVPWLTKLYADFFYIYIIRDPRDVILKPHFTDDLMFFGVPFKYGSERTAVLMNARGTIKPTGESTLLQRAISWKYQAELFKATPRPEHLLILRFEDLVLDQKTVLQKMEEFLRAKLKSIKMRPESVGRYKEKYLPAFDFLKPNMREYGYAV